MITRIVKLEFLENEVEHFFPVFNEMKLIIVNFRGCHGMKLMQHVSEKNIFFTYSIWDDEISLNEYRKSDLFRQTWNKLKPMFKNKAEAWTLNVFFDGFL